MDFDDYLKSSKKSLFRWEKLQWYADDEEMFRKYKETGDVDWEEMSNWNQFLLFNLVLKISMQRVRLVVEPMNEYTRMELKIHWASTGLGDKIRKIDEESYKKIGIDFPDFWLIDDKTVLLMKYGSQGQYEGFEAVEATPELLHFKNELWERSVELEDPM